MSSTVKFLIGLAAVLAMGWLYHGPLGHGRAFVNSLEAQARAKVSEAQVPGIDVLLGQDPLTRVATLSGPANDLQREGLGSQLGLTDLVAGVEGVSEVEWADQPERASGVPLLLELLLLLLLAYLVGIGIARLFWGRKPRKGFY